MAEERLIDDDKDRKYRIRKNENGEEELILLGDDELGEESEAPEYDVVTPEDEDLSDEAERAYEEWQADRDSKAEGFKASAREKMLKGDFLGAREDLEQASLLTEYDGELYFLLLKAYSLDLSDFSDLERLADIADGVKEYSDDAQKSELSSLSAPLKEELEKTQKTFDELHSQNEEGKAQRRETFLKQRKRARIAFSCTGLPFLALFIVAIVFASMIYADKNGLYIVLTIVFAATAAAALIVSLFTLKGLINANRKVRLNEKDSSTRIGREFSRLSETLNSLNKIYTSFSNDLS